MSLQRRELLALPLLAGVPGISPGPSRAASSRPVLRLGGSALSPLILGIEGSPLRGALPQFVKDEIAPRTSIQFEWMPPATGILAVTALRDGAVDLLLCNRHGATKVPGTAQFKWICWQSAPCLAVAADSPLRELGSSSALARLRVGSEYRRQIPPELAGARISWVPAAGIDWEIVNMRKLKEGHIQAALYSSALTARYLARKENVAVRTLTLPMMASEIPFAMSYSLGAPKVLIDEFESLALAAFKGDKFRKRLESYSD